MIQTSTFHFLSELKTNNSKSWMDQHRAESHTAKADVAAMAGKLIDRLGKIDPAIKQGGLDGAKCLTRLNRDMRFAKGASPYKTDFYIVLNSAGKKSERAFYYLHVEPGNCFVGGGVYNPQPGPLRKFREKIGSHYANWEKIITDRHFQKRFPTGIHTPSLLTRVPSGFSPDSPAAEFFKMKGFYTMEKLDDREVQAKQAVAMVTEYFKAARSLVDFLNRALQRDG